MIRREQAMSLEDPIQLVREWEVWAIDHLDPQDLPSPVSSQSEMTAADVSTSGPPWHDDLSDWQDAVIDDDEGDREALREAIATALSAPLADPRITRFVLVNALNSLVTAIELLYGPDDAEDDEDEPLAPWEHDPEDLDSALRWVSDILEDCICRLPTEEVALNYPALAWEVSCAYLIEDWARARSLLDRGIAALGDEEQSATLRLARGVLEVLLNLGSQSEPPRPLGAFAAAWWPPSRPSKHVAAAQPALIFLLAEVGKAKKPSEPWRGLDAAMDYLRPSVLESQALIAAAYRGRGLFAACRFGEAAREYEALAAAAVKTPSPIRAEEAFASVVRCYREAGDFLAAETWVTRWVTWRGADADLALTIAELRAGRGDYVGAYQKVRELLVDGDDEQAIDWRTATLLALGGVATGRADAAKLDALLAGQPDVSLRIRSLLGDYWPTFEKLDVGSRALWEQGMYYLLWGEAPPDYQAGLLEDAASKFAKVVEKELRDNVFRALREEANNAPTLQADLLAHITTKDLKLYFTGERNHLSLGSMAWLIHHHGIPQARTFFTKRFPGLLKTKRELERVIAFRNPSFHASEPQKRSYTDVGRACRAVLDSVHVNR
jgi:hypothetical protein